MIHQYELYTTQYAIPLFTSIFHDLSRKNLLDKVFRSPDQGHDKFPTFSSDIKETFISKKLFTENPKYLHIFEETLTSMLQEKQDQKVSTPELLLFSYDKKSDNLSFSENQMLYLKEFIARLGGNIEEYESKKIIELKSKFNPQEAAKDQSLLSAGQLILVKGQEGNLVYLSLSEINQKLQNQTESSQTFELFTRFGGDKVILDLKSLQSLVIQKEKRSIEMSIFKGGYTLQTQLIVNTQTGEVQVKVLNQRGEEEIIKTSLNTKVGESRTFVFYSSSGKELRRSTSQELKISYQESKNKSNRRLPVIPSKVHFINPVIPKSSEKIDLGESNLQPKKLNSSKDFIVRQVKSSRLKTTLPNPEAKAQKIKTEADKLEDGSGESPSQAQERIQRDRQKAMAQHYFNVQSPQKNGSLKGKSKSSTKKKKSPISSFLSKTGVVAGGGAILSYLFT